MQETTKTKFPFGILIACCLTIFGATGCVFGPASVFYSAVCESLGVGRGTFAMYMTIALLVMAFFMPVAGKLVSKYGLRTVMICSGISLALSFVLFSLAKSMLLIYVGAVFQGLGLAIPTYTLVPTLIGNWFKKSVGLLTGLAMSFSALGGIILQPVLGAVISRSSWNVGYLILAAISFACVTLPAIFLVRVNPSDVGKLPYGAEEVKKDDGVKVAAPAEKSVSLRDAMKSPAFFLLAAVSGILNLTSCVNYYLTSYATTSLGFPLTIAATISSVAMYGQLIGKLGLGGVSDRSLNLSIILAFGCGFVGMIGLWLLGSSINIVVLVILILLYGIIYGSVGVMMPVLARNCFGSGKDFAPIFSNVMSFGTFCSAVGSSLFGFLFDWTGSFDIVFIVGFVLAALGMIASFAAVSNAKKLPRS